MPSLKPLPIASFVAYLLALLNLRFPLLRFSSPVANCLFFAAAQFLLFFALKSAARRVGLLALAAPVFVFALVLMVGSLARAADDVSDGADLGFEPQGFVVTPLGRVVAYRTNGGDAALRRVPKAPPVVELLAHL
jgi:hypothetical protein